MAATWYPVNDHPIDKAAYTIPRSPCPQGLEAVANGVLIGTRHLTAGRPGPGTPTSRWRRTSRRRRSASSTCDAYGANGIKYLGRDRPGPLRPRRPRPATGRQFAISQARRAVVQAADAHDRRARRRRRSCRSGSTATPSPTGTSSSSRRTRRAATDWTTLPDLNGHTGQDARGVVLSVLARDPPVPRALPDRRRRRTCSPTGYDRDVARRVAARSDGYERWRSISAPTRGARSRCRSRT